MQKHTVEFNQVAMANSEGSEVMLNRVMTKDNIGVAVLLKVNKDMFSGGKNSWEPPRNSGGGVEKSWGCDAFEPQGVSVDLAGNLKVGSFLLPPPPPPPGMKPPQERQLILVANAHMHWDPEYSDVKLIQTMMFLSELKSIAERASGSVATGSPTSDPSAIPIVLCADLNSLPDSGTDEPPREPFYSVKNPDFSP